MPMTMDERIEHATAAAQAYFLAKGESAARIEDHDVADLVADILHLAHALGFDIKLLEARARMHFEAEQAGEC